MAGKINHWWSLPVFSGIAGIVLAWWLYPQNPLVSQGGEATKYAAQGVITDSVKLPASEPEPIVATRVMLPPAPKVQYVPQYQAKLVNNQLVLQANQPVIKPETRAPSLDELMAQGQVSAELASRFTRALAEMEADEVKSEQPRKLHPQALTLYPQWYQDLVPTLEFSSHIYSSDKDNRWVKVNQQMVKEGELINADLRLVEITPEQVIIEMQQRQFTLPALSSW